MPQFTLSAVLICLTLLFFPVRPNPNPVEIELITNYGRIVVRLYDQTPLHRDNFIKLIESKTYDSLLFHRVIKGFMIQAGDIKSKTADSLARLGSTDLPYQIPAEIVPELFHKKGALAAARNNNPLRASSSTQFYIVQGVIQNDSLLNHNQNRINQSLGRYYARLDSANKPLFDSLEAAQTQKDSLEIRRLNARAESVLSTYTNFTRYAIPEEHQKIYREIGGSPHLDQSYTVFGEVVSGLEVVDAIAGVSTNPQNRPLIDVRILSARIISEK
jgi:peptidyl-prolyl cis-trans isomerase B (cyclophilin B)